jgi:hypothetical protein
VSVVQLWRCHTRPCCGFCSWGSPHPVGYSHPPGVNSMLKRSCALLGNEERGAEWEREHIKKALHHVFLIFLQADTNSFSTFFKSNPTAFCTH